MCALTPAGWRAARAPGRGLRHQRHHARIRFKQEKGGPDLGLCAAEAGGVGLSLPLLGESCQAGFAALAGRRLCKRSVAERLLLNIVAAGVAGACRAASLCRVQCGEQHV